jgi:hypothetical protein
MLVLVLCICSSEFKKCVLQLTVFMPVHVLYMPLSRIHLLLVDMYLEEGRRGPSASLSYSDFFRRTPTFICGDRSLAEERRLLAIFGRDARFSPWPSITNQIRPSSKPHHRNHVHKPAAAPHPLRSCVSLETPSCRLPDILACACLPNQLSVRPLQTCDLFPEHGHARICKPPSYPPALVYLAQLYPCDGDDTQPSEKVISN